MSHLKYYSFVLLIFQFWYSTVIWIVHKVPNLWQIYIAAANLFLLISAVSKTSSSMVTFLTRRLFWFMTSFYLTMRNRRIKHCCSWIQISLLHMEPSVAKYIRTINHFLTSELGFPKKRAYRLLRLWLARLRLSGALWKKTLAQRILVLTSCNFLRNIANFWKFLSVIFFMSTNYHHQRQFFLLY